VWSGLPIGVCGRDWQVWSGRSGGSGRFDRGYVMQHAGKAR
jgi:hypothetical protein